MSVSLNYTTVTAPAGAYGVVVPAIRFRRIIQVSREGVIYDLIHSNSLSPVTPPNGTREVSYYAPLGQLIFPADEIFEPGETITVKWR